MQWKVIDARAISFTGLLLLSVAVLLMAVLPSAAQPGWYPEAQKPLPDVPEQLVNDWAALLQPQEVQRLEEKLVAFNDTAGVQIAVLTLATLNGYDIAQLAFRIGDHWGIGSREHDSGLLLLIAVQERQVFIATGKGMEGVLPDVLARRIVDQIIVPAFREQQYFTGIDQATDVIMQLSRGEFPAVLQSNEEIDDFWLIVILIVMLLFFGWVTRKFFGMRGYIDRGGWHGLPTGGFPRSFGGGWSGGSRGGSSFGGFGGGSFGGGGAGGRW